MGYGFRVDSMSRIDSVLDDLGDVDGFVFEIGENESPYETVSKVHEYSSSRGFKALVNVRLAPEDPAVYPRDDLKTANRIAETVLTAHYIKDVSLLLDTFMDHDRGYFPRAGLYDRLLNPRMAANVLRNLDSLLMKYGELTGISWRELDKETVIEFDEEASHLILGLPSSKQINVHETDGILIDLVGGVVNPSTTIDGPYLVVQEK
jgi:hypothetical protein